MKLAIITRTSNRPKLFRRCVESVKQQSIDVEHHVVVDNQQSYQYVADHDVHMIHQVDLNTLRDQQIHSDPPTTTRPPGKTAVHNLYFNQVYEHIESDWVYHLDDDNYLKPETLHRLTPLLKDDVDMVVIRADSFAGTLPTFRDCVMHKIRLCAIDTGCFVARTEMFKHVKWDGWKCGDYRVIVKCDELSRNTTWANLVLMRMETNGDGLQQDRDVDLLI